MSCVNVIHYHDTDCKVGALCEWDSRHGLGGWCLVRSSFENMSKDILIKKKDPEDLHDLKLLTLSIYHVVIDCGGEGT